MKFVFTYLIFLSTIFSSLAQQNSKTKIMNDYEGIRKEMPREKIYLHVDRNTYATGDTLWFKAYLVDASLLSQSEISALIYVEMSDANGNLAQRVALPTTMGLTWGAFALNSSLYNTGKYTLRAYTNWQRNFGEDYFFKKDINIIEIPNRSGAIANTVRTKTTTGTASFVTNINSKSTLDIQFLPEGGNLVVDKEQKIAFKAINADGKGIEINGSVYDSKNQKLVDFKSNAKGMGYFPFTAKLNENYFAVVKNANSEKKISLPKAQNLSPQLQVINPYQGDSITINFSSNLPDQILTLVGESRGIVCFLAQFKSPFNGKSIKVNKNVFPTGVAKIVLLDDKKQPTNERNFFINHNDQLEVNLNANKTSFELRDSVALRLTVNDQAKVPVLAAFSVAVTTDEQIFKDDENEQNILSYFLLTADLKGEIENVGSYFTNYDEKKHLDLDALMLTQGWVSYNWDLKKKPAFKAEKEYAITGKVTNLLNSPAANAKVTMLGKSKTFMLADTITNNNGEFTFKKLPFMDSAVVVINVVNAKGKTGTLGINVDEFTSPKFSIINSVPTENLSVQDSVNNGFVTAKQTVQRGPNSGGIALREVNITGKRIIAKSKNLNGPGVSDQAVTEDDLDKNNKKTLLQVLQEKIKGFRDGSREETTVTKPGGGPESAKTYVRDYMVDFMPAKFIIDGIDIDFFYAPMQDPPLKDEHFQYVQQLLEGYLAEDLNGVEVMQVPKNSGAYRMQFLDPKNWTLHSFIEITTKTGAGPFLKKNSNIYLHRPLTYGDTKIFYSPKYTASNKTDKNPDLRTTIYWHPNLIANGETTIPFFTSDQKGTYTVWVEGTDQKGNFGFKTMKLTVK